MNTLTTIVTSTARRYDMKDDRKWRQTVKLIRSRVKPKFNTRHTGIKPGRYSLALYAPADQSVRLSVRTRTALLQVSTTRSRRPRRSQLQRLRLTSVTAEAGSSRLAASSGATSRLFLAADKYYSQVYEKRCTERAAENWPG